MANQLTSRQAEVFGFIKRFIAANDYSPSVRDIGEHFGMTQNGVQGHIKALERKGVIMHAPFSARTITICNGARPTLTLDDVDAACAQECDDRYAELWQLGWRAAMEAVRNKLGINKDGAVTTPHG